MALITINWQPTAKELRAFAALWLVFFGLLGAWMAWRGNPAVIYLLLWGTGFCGGLLGFAVPAAVRPLYVAWMCLAFPIGWVISHLLLGLVYFGLLLPTGLLLRLFGNDPMQRTIDRDCSSYWSPRKQEDEPSRYFRQF